MNTICGGALLSLALAAIEPSQSPPKPSPPTEAMAALSALEGRWAGEGWMRQGPGEPQSFRGQETVEKRLAGQLLTIEGIHRAGQPEHVVHHAFAVISYNASTGRFRFLSFLADGRAGDYEGQLKDGAFVWGFENPQQGQVRFTIRVSNEEWHEIGEATRDGLQWSQFFEMKLRRVH
jgi:hypothetical protein